MVKQNVKTNTKGRYLYHLQEKIVINKRIYCNQTVKFKIWIWIPQFAGYAAFAKNINLTVNFNSTLSYKFPIQKEGKSILNRSANSSINYQLKSDSSTSFPHSESIGLAHNRNQLYGNDNKPVAYIKEVSSIDDNPLKIANFIFPLSKLCETLSKKANMK